MPRKVFRAGNSLVVSIPVEAAELLSLTVGTEVTIEVDREHHRLTISPARIRGGVVDIDFASHVDEFLHRYGPTLEALAEGE